MRYSDLINFTPIESVIEIKEAEIKEKAINLVKNYVISDEISEKFEAGILSQLRLEEVMDNKGVLIVGNYGTGKSHLMSVISLVASEDNYLDYVNNLKFRTALKQVSGRFEVLRIEVGAVNNSLRNIVVKEIERDLEKKGIDYQFPSITEITNNKGSFQEMMSLFEQKFPGKGYMLVIDELLDFLRSKKEHDLMQDLGFLRELGEFIKNSRFRLMCGIQEQLFDNPTFSFVSKSLNRVKDRFQQVIIRKEDTAFLVSERILAKTTEQKAKIREHLLPYCSLYTEMSERIETFVELYPIHPSFIDTFNKVSSAERREVLTTISKVVRELLDKDVPEAAPGIISFDAYWSYIKDNYALRAEPDIKEVMDKSSVLEDKISRSFPKRLYKAVALQIINALSVHRLTTSGIDVKIGLSAENLKDDLCLYIENMPEMEPEFLLSMIQTVLKDITNLVSGQFIEFNSDNGQYFLDLKKDIDYDAKIAQKAELLSEDELNRYFYSIVYDCLEWDEEQYVPNFQIYEYVLNWASHNVYRRGYLFMGVPEVRSTAEPPRDFYINILPPYGVSEKPEDKNVDEVYFKFKDEEKFNSILKLYSGALAMKELASDQNTRAIYNKKADNYRKQLLLWINENRNTCFSVIYKGLEKQLIQVTHGKTRANSNFKDTMDLAASICLEEYFTSVYPEFPVMKTKVTKDNQADLIQRAIRYYSGQKAMDSAAFLESFGLISNGKIDIKNSKYAMSLARKLDKLPQQGVINYSELVKEKYDEVYDSEFNINIEYFSVVLLALVYSGKANLVLRNGTTLQASNLDTLPKLGLPDFQEFKYLAKPKQASMEELQRLFEILDIPTGLLINPSEMEKGLEKALEKTKEIADKALKAKISLNSNPTLWGEPLLQSHIANNYLDKIEKVLNEFVNFKNKYNTVAKLNNFNMTLEELDSIEEGIKNIKLIDSYMTFKSENESLVNYISNIETMELTKALTDSIKIAKDKFRKLRDEIKNTSDSESATREISIELGRLKENYIEYYFNIHQKARLGINEGNKKGNLINSKSLSNLKRLSGIESIFQVNKLREIEKQLSELKICYALTTKEMQQTHICQHCKLNITASNENASSNLKALEGKLEGLYEEWTNILLKALEDPLILANKELLAKEQQNLVEKFIREKALPETVDNYFISTFNTLFSELDKIALNVEDILNQILTLGPCTVEDLKNKINFFIENMVRGKDKAKLRIIVQQNKANNYDIAAEESKAKEY